MSELTYSKQLSGILASFSVIVMLGANLIQTMTVDASTLMFALTRVIPVAFVMGFLGHLTGTILDNSKSQKTKNKE